MPLTEKGSTILKSLTQEYGPEKAKKVLYAGKNAGTFTGIDAARDPHAIHQYMDYVVKGDSIAMARHKFGR